MVKELLAVGDTVWYDAGILGIMITQIVEVIFPHEWDAERGDDAMSYVTAVDDKYYSREELAFGNLEQMALFQVISAKDS